MRFRLFYFAPVLMLMCSCNIHQYLSFSSELPMNNSGAFFDDNDSLAITYTFTGAKTIKIEMENKSDQLVFVDWSRSSMIFNGQSLSFANGMSKIEGTGTGTSNQYIEGMTSANFEGTVSQSPTKSYIPPNSRIIREFAGVPIQFINSLRKTHSFEKILLRSSAKKFSFDESNTLNVILSYISVGVSDEGQFRVINHRFWMSDVVETIEGNLRIKGNQFRTSK
jgi:hypothetical protein